MPGGVYYNEFDRQKAAWLRHLIEEGVIASGVVDERPIQAVQPEDLHGFAQCHFFAGIGLWSLCLRRAGWDDDRPVWTGSCPCGPFSIAGKGEGFADPRHLWPEWFRLIRIRRPVVLFGEQSDQAVEWLDLVQDDLEGISYAIGSPDLPAAGFGGSHERQRFGFVADTDNAEWWSERAPWHDGDWPKAGRVQGYRYLGDGSAHGPLGYAGGAWSRGYAGADARAQGAGAGAGAGPQSRLVGDKSRPSGPTGGPGVAQGDASLAGLPDAQLGIVRRSWGREEGRAAEQPGDPLGPGVDWLLCRDSRWRPIESISRALADAGAVDLGRVRRGRMARLEKEVNDAVRTSGYDCSREAMLDLWRAHSQAAVQGGSPSGASGVREAQVLLAFLRQLARQGWPLAERIQCESAETERAGVRGLRDGEAPPCPSCGRGLDEQRPEQYPDLVRLLSPILAQHAQEARIEAEHANASVLSPACFPLVGKDDPARMLRLRGYGDAIDVETFTNLIGAYLDAAPARASA